MRQREIEGFPIDAIDGTHIKIKAQTTDEHLYVNRKHFHSINVQCLCDSKLKFLNIVAKWPGSTHDSYICNNSSLKLIFYNGTIFFVSLVYVENFFRTSSTVLTWRLVFTEFTLSHILSQTLFFWLLVTILDNFDKITVLFFSTSFDNIWISASEKFVFRVPPILHVHVLHRLHSLFIWFLNNGIVP